MNRSKLLRDTTGLRLAPIFWLLSLVLLGALVPTGAGAAARSGHVARACASHHPRAARSRCAKSPVRHVRRRPGSQAKIAFSASAVPLATSGSFAVMAGSGITNTGPTTVGGDLGTYPTTTMSGTATLTVTGTNHGGDAVTQQAKSDLGSAYDNAAGQGPPSPIATDLGGQTLVPGVYNSASSIGLTGALTLDAGGDPNAVFIFQAGSTLTTASGSQVNLINGAQPCNVFWQVGSSATLGTGSSFLGTILALTSITVTHAVTLDGRALAANGAVTLDTDTIVSPTCAKATGGTTGSTTGTAGSTGGGTTGSSTGTTGSTGGGTTGSSTGTTGTGTTGGATTGTTGGATTGTTGPGAIGGTTTTGTTTGGGGATTAGGTTTGSTTATTGGGATTAPNVGASTTGTGTPPTGAPVATAATIGATAGVWTTAAMPGRLVHHKAKHRKRGVSHHKGPHRHTFPRRPAHPALRPAGFTG